MTVILFTADTEYVTVWVAVSCANATLAAATARTALRIFFIISPFPNLCRVPHHGGLQGRYFTTTGALHILFRRLALRPAGCATSSIHSKRPHTECTSLLPADRWAN